MSRNSIGLYLHIPFCAAKCAYCDFYSAPPIMRQLEDYIEALCRAIRACPPDTVDSVYFGGGTPSLLGSGALLRLLDCVREHFSLSPDAEITVEMNPASALGDDLARLRAGGFTRVSFGVQSMLDGELRALGRRHTAAEAETAILAAHEAGFAHISADLMLVIPGQTGDSLAFSIEALAALPLDHVSAYLLKVEPGTPLARQSPVLPDEDETAALYLSAVELLKARGLAQYEISNFARPGGASRHNLKYWRLEPYLGLGPSAHSFFGGRRRYFPSDLNAFLAAENPLSLWVDDGSGGDFDEYVMLRLRLCEGLSLRALAGRYGEEQALALRRRAARIPPELLSLRDETLCLTVRGFLLSNQIIGALLA